MNKLSILAPTVLIALLAGCYIEKSSSPDEGDDYFAPPDDVRTLSIDSDATLTDVVPGAESGVYVEYSAGGLWFVSMTCGDLETYGPCTWDIVTTVLDGSFVGAEPYDLEAAEDELGADDLGAWVYTYTTTDTDGFYIQTTPGATLKVDVLLDELSAPEYLFWVGGGGVHQGAPSNPVELVPTEP